MVDDEIRRKLELYFGSSSGDVVRAEELYHEDAVVEFPQSGERFEGRVNFTEWRQYPSEVSFDVVRQMIRGDLAVVELMAAYGGGTTMYGVALLEFRGDKIAHEIIYVAEGWDAPEWRAPWRVDVEAG